LGPLIGGFLADNAGSWFPSVEGWRWVFYVNLPLGAVALWFIVTRMPRLHPSEKSRRLDLISVGLMILAFFPLVLALQLDKSRHAWTSPEVGGLLLGGAVFLLVWIVHSLKVSRYPILDLKLFRNPVFTTGVIAAFFFGAGFLSILIFLPLYMVNVQGVSATGAGASVIPLTLGIVLGAGLGGSLATRMGRYKAILVLGALVCLAGCLLMTGFSAQTPFWFIVVSMVVTGVGFGPAQSLYSVAIQNAVPVRELGQATSFNQFSRQIGSTVGAAVAGALFSAAIAAAFTSPNGQETTHSFSPMELRQGPQEIRAEISRSFDKTIDQVRDLFDLRGEEAQAALRKVLDDPNTPTELRNKLRNGTPATQIEASFARLYADLETIVKAGDKTALEALFASQEGEVLPAPSRAGIEALVAQPRAARLAGLPRLRQQMESGREKAIEGSSFVAQAVVTANLQKAESKAADGAIAKIARAFARAIEPIWWFNAVLLAFLLVATAIIPSRPLRKKGEVEPEETAFQ